MAIAATFAVVGCGGTGFDPLTTPAEDSTTVWGGQHARLQLRKDSLPRLDYDCAHGGMDRVPTPNDRGEFTAMGFHVRMHGGPIRVGEPEDRHPAEYFGVISGDVLTLRVRLVDSGDEIGPFTLRRGSTGVVYSCL
jgi:hypothetical protein